MNNQNHTEISSQTLLFPMNETQSKIKVGDLVMVNDPKHPEYSYHAVVKELKSESRVILDNKVSKPFEADLKQFRFIREGDSLWKF